MLIFIFMAFMNFLSDLLYDSSGLILFFQKDEIELDEAHNLLYTRVGNDT